MADVLGRCNTDSYGLAAEALLKTISACAGNRQGGSWEGGREIVSGHLISLGVDRDEFFIDDGSGLSAKDRLSPNAITAVLRDVYAGPRWDVFKGSLATGGQSGTIAKYFKEKKYKGRVFGKTGYIAGVKSFSGVCSTGNGDYIFSIITNKAWNGKTRGAINDIVKTIIDTNR